MAEIGFMQGRLSPIAAGKIQAFPWNHWRDEFAIAHRCGFTRMEWTLDQDRLAENPLMSETGRQAIKVLSADYSLEIHSLTGDCFMQAPFWKASGAEREGLLDVLKSVLAAAAAFGIRWIVIPLVDNGGLETEAHAENLFQGLKTVQSLLSDNSLKIVFESDFPPAKLRAFIDQLDPKHFGVNYDSGNSAALGYNPEVEIKTYGDRIDNVHVKDRLLGGGTVPLGTGNANLPKVFELLQAVEYSGQYILQTARATEGDHAAVLCRYRDQVQQWLAQTTQHGFRTDG